MICNKQTLAVVRILLLPMMLVALSACGNKRPKEGPVVINEVLVDNETNFVDDYGNRSAWIELYNRSAATVDVRGFYLTDDRNDLRKYAIPKGDILTKIAPRQQLLFRADGMAARGTLHTNFELKKGEDNFIALVSGDGKTILDSVTIPASLAADQSYCRIPDGNVSAEDKAANNIWKVAGPGAGVDAPKVTPQGNNQVIDANEKLQALKERDPHGGVMTITAMLVVFLGLAVLFLLFKLTGNSAVALSKRRFNKSVGKEQTSSGKLSNGAFIPGDVSAAIGMALYEAMEEAHDTEDDVLTLVPTERKYSPWSSKIYGLRTPLGPKKTSQRNR